MLEITDNAFCAHLKKLDLGCVQNVIHHKVKSVYLFIYCYGLKQLKFILSWFWKLTGRNRGIGRAILPPKPMGRILPCLLKFPVASAILKVLRIVFI